MRDVVVSLIVLVGLVYTLKRPYIGILLWSWLSYMNPHRLTFGFAYSMPFAQITAVVLLGAILFSKQKQGIPLGGITIAWSFFVLFMGLTTVLAYFPDEAAIQFKKVIKIQLVTFLTFVVITDFDKLKKLIWVIVLSIGFYSVKGGVYTILQGGGGRVWGPPGGFIQDNNNLAVAILMVIPLMIFLYNASANLWVKKGLVFATILSMLSVLGSQSRGALLAIAAVGLFFWFKSNKKIVSAFLITIVAVGLYRFMPESWFERMNTMRKFEEDSSAVGRLNAWEYAVNAANNNVFGMGLESWSYETFALYAPNPLDMHAAHSIYFSTLADHGWIGLILFLLIFFMAWRKLKGIIKKTKDNDELSEYNFVARMIQISFIAYFVGGAFLSLAYFDLPWHLVSLAVLLDVFLERKKLLDDNNENII